MTRRAYKVHADAYGVRVEVRVEHADGATAQELARALDIAAATARHRHKEASPA